MRDFLLLVNKMISERLRLFQKLTDTKDFQKVKGYSLSNERIQEVWDANDLGQLEKMLLDCVSELPNNRIFVHPCPIDESTYKNYSFAGVYKSYKPYRMLDSTKNIKQAVCQITHDRFSYYADFYYENINANTPRYVDLFVSCENDNICGFGTGYVDSKRCLFQYFDTPLSIHRREAVKISATKETISDIHNTLHSNIIRALFAVQEQIEDTIDIEFVFDKKDMVFINEVRAVSFPHKKNWMLMDEKKWNFGSTLSIQLNSVGKRFRRVKKWTADFNLASFDSEKDLLYIDYVSDMHLFEILLQMRGVNNICLFISYPFFIIDNHFSYTLGEYSNIDFIVRGINANLIDGSLIQIESYGSDYSFDIVQSK